jgi:hypothetical protein
LYRLHKMKTALFTSGGVSSSSDTMLLLWPAAPQAL